MLSDVSLPAMFVNLIRKIVIDRGSWSDRPRYDANKNCTPPLPLALAAPRHMPAVLARS